MIDDRKEELLATVVPDVEWEFEDVASHLRWSRPWEASVHLEDASWTVRAHAVSATERSYTLSVYAQHDDPARDFTFQTGEIDAALLPAAAARCRAFIRIAHEGP